MAATIRQLRFVSQKLFRHNTNELFNYKATYRYESTACPIKVSKLIYKEYGDPVKVITQCDDQISSGDIKCDDVLVKMLAAPVNPADINTIQGKYPVKPVLPSVPGNEGVGEVIDVGKQVKNLEKGDRVIFLKNALGTWQSHLFVNQADVYKIPRKLGIIEAATFTVNPCTAYRMLRDFVDLKPGDTVIQNGANSACGQNVIQIARVWGLCTVNIVRDRPNIQELKKELKCLGANHVLTEEELRTTDIFKKNVKKPRLALNAVGGKNALEVLRHLANQGTMVTYGGMSREPVTVPTSALIFKDVNIRGFWMTRWSAAHAQSPERKEMFEELISMMTNNEMQPAAYTKIPFQKYKDALLNALPVSGKQGKKYILSFCD